MAARLGVNYRALLSGDTALSLSGQVSQGLGDLHSLGVISLPDATAAGVPFSRNFASTKFTKLNATLHLAGPLGNGLTYVLNARGQSSFGKSVFRSEQVSLDGADGVSAYVGGQITQDEGVVARLEVGTSKRLGAPGTGLFGGYSLAPYLFAAGATGRINAPTAVEPDHITAASLGAGARIAVGRALSVGVEFAHGLASVKTLDGANRGNVTTTLRF